MRINEIIQQFGDRSHHTGFGSANNLYLTYIRDFSIASCERRQQLRQEGCREI